MPKKTTTPARNSTAAEGGEALFDAGVYRRVNEPRTLEEIPIEQLLVVANPRKLIDQPSIWRMAGSLMRRQLMPGLGWRKDERTVHLYDGQRRKLAAELSHALAGTDGYERLGAVAQLRVLLFDQEPTEAEIRQAQAQANAHEALAIPDLQAHFEQLWRDYDGLEEETRMVRVCEDLGIDPRTGHSLRRQLTLPVEIRSRVARTPADGEISIRLAGKLAEMNTVAPKLARAVADRVVTRELNNAAVNDLGSFVHLTVTEDDGVYAVRLQEGESVMVAHTEIARARAHLDPSDRRVITGTLKCVEDKLEESLDQLERDAKTRGAMITINQPVRDLAINGGFAYVYHRGRDLVDAVWVVDPTFMLGLAHDALATAPGGAAQSEPGYFRTAQDDEAREARKDADAQARIAALRYQTAYSRNLSIGERLGALMIEPTAEQLDAVRQLVCHLLAEHFGELIAFGAGWSDIDRQQPVGDTKRFEPRQPDAIVTAELQRALSDRDPLRGIAQLATRLAAAFVLDSDGVSVTKALGRQRMQSHLRDALPGGEHPARAALWAVIRDALSPALIEMHRDSFVFETPPSTADLAAQKATVDLDEIDLGDEAVAA